MFRKMLYLALIATCQVWAAPVSRETAQQVAKNWFEFNTRSANPVTNEVFEAKSQSQVAYYAFSFEHGGFVIVSGDDAALPVIAYSPVSKIDQKITESEKIENPAVSAWLTNYKQQISDLTIQKAENAQNKQIWQQILAKDFSYFIAKNTKEVLPLVTTTWNQRYPYNMYCPMDNGVQAVVGCVATALVQIMRYHQYPLHGQGTHSYSSLGQNLTVNFAQQTYNWSNMPNSGIDADFYKQQELAKISYHAGVAVDMNYSANGSGAYTSDVPELLISHFKYSPEATYDERYSYDDAQWTALLKSELDNQRPMEYSGHGAAGGHAFVCDGYQNGDFFHFNWGWEGKYDGYFYVNNLNPGTYTFNESQGLVYKIHPAETVSISAPESLTMNCSASAVNLHWENSNSLPVISYNIYRNGALLGTSNTTNYTDNTYGIESFYTYFVTAVGNSQESNPSNTIVLDQGAPTVITVGGNVALVGQKMLISLKLDDLSAVSQVSAIYNIAGVNHEIEMLPVTLGKHAQLFSCELPIQDDCIEGTIKFKMKDSGNYEATSVNYNIYWFYATNLTDDFATADFSNFNWEFEGNANWTIDQNGTNKYAKSGAIGNNKVTALRLNKIFPIAGTVNFKKKVSSEADYDKLRFYIDGKKKAEWSGNVAWSSETFPVEPGEHILKWSYEKDAGSVGGSDCAWIDDVELIGVASTGTVGFDSESNQVPKNISLGQNYPNPFNPTTTIRFTLDKTADIELNIYNTRGELVKTLAKGQLNSGIHNYSFDATSLNSGVYLYELKSGNTNIVNKMLLVK